MKCRYMQEFWITNILTLFTQYLKVQPRVNWFLFRWFLRHIEIDRNQIVQDDIDPKELYNNFNDNISLQIDVVHKVMPQLIEFWNDFVEVKI